MKIVQVNICLKLIILVIAKIKVLDKLCSMQLLRKTITFNDYLNFSASHVQSNDTNLIVVPDIRSISGWYISILF